MLIEFRVGNFRSIKETVTFSMVAAPIEEHAETHTFATNYGSLLKSAVIYGANASGKSNLLKAMAFMKTFVLNSSKESQATETIPVERFRLSTATANAPSFFEVTFICDGNKYRYGFEVDRQNVHAEWLFVAAPNAETKRETKLFVRDGNNFSLGRAFKEGKGLQSKTRPNALFLSVIAQFNGEIATKILEWFMNLEISSGIDDTAYQSITEDLLRESEGFRKIALIYLQTADLGIRDITVEKIKVPVADLPEHLKKSWRDFTDADELDGFRTSFLHNIYNEHQESVGVEKFDLTFNESEGTQKFLGLLGPLVKTLGERKILIVDELDARLHPLLTRFLINVFHFPQANPHHAQLIFATHDTNLLTNELFRKDQIWFTEKNKYGATDLYSLVEFKPTQKTEDEDTSFRTNYILGKYGAIPFIGNIELLLGREQ